MHGNSHACLQREQRGEAYAVTRVCATPRREPRVASACLVAVRSARGVVPPCRARVWSVLTDSQRPTSGRKGQKGAFRATYARSPRAGLATKTLEWLSALALGSTPRASRARGEAMLTAALARCGVRRSHKLDPL